jgi:murein L,D-transpeptidase YafK
MKKLLPSLLILSAGLSATLYWTHGDPFSLPPGTRADRILVEKAARRLTLFDGLTPLKQYAIALGRSPVGPKQREGDGRTPEGTYFIDRRKSNSAFHRALHVSYPSVADTTKAAGVGFSPGGDIMIHGLRNGLGWLGAIHRSADWTAGCIAVTNAQIEEIWQAVPNGVPIEIRP